MATCTKSYFSVEHPDGIKTELIRQVTLGKDSLALITTIDEQRFLSLSKHAMRDWIATRLEEIAHGIRQGPSAARIAFEAGQKEILYQDKTITVATLDLDAAIAALEVLD